MVKLLREAHLMQFRIKSNEKITNSCIESVKDNFHVYYV